MGGAGSEHLLENNEKQNAGGQLERAPSRAGVATTDAGDIEDLMAHLELENPPETTRKVEILVTGGARSESTELLDKLRDDERRVLTRLLQLTEVEVSK